MIREHRSLSSRLGLVACLGLLGCAGCGSGARERPGEWDQSESDSGGDGGDRAPVCDDGVDRDGDGFGADCAAGPDCDDHDRSVNPGMTEVCNGIDDDCDGDIDEKLLNPCGTCGDGCQPMERGTDAGAILPLPGEDDAVQAEGTRRNDEGHIVLGSATVNFHHMWIANTDDWGSGTVSKINTASATEVGRYFSVTCFGNSSYRAGACEAVPNDCHLVGEAVECSTDVQQSGNKPSRTAVDFNFDVWVANRAFGGQPSVTKIANAEADCLDRDGDGVVSTSRDVNRDGHITVDCDEDGQPDGKDTLCTIGGLSEPEFLGWDDECVLFTVNYGFAGQNGRSVCLDGGATWGEPGRAWVGTNSPAPGTTSNQFYQIDGASGEILQVVDIPAGHSPYGCVVDRHDLLWTVSQGTGIATEGRLLYFDATDPTARMGEILQPDLEGRHSFYGLSLDHEDNLWLGGWATSDVYRYRPAREGEGFTDLANGTWTRIETSSLGVVDKTAGVAADMGGNIWVAANNGCLLRLPQDVADGDHDADALGVEWFSPGAGLNCELGGAMRGVGVDLAGHIWAISHDASTATRLDVDSGGQPTGVWTSLDVGLRPYTYSDFTGFGLRNFTRSRGSYILIWPECGPNYDTHWREVRWDALVPADTALAVRVRSRLNTAEWGDWFGPWTDSPANLIAPPVGPLQPNPAGGLEVEFLFTSNNGRATPALRHVEVLRDCRAVVF